MLAAVGTQAQGRSGLAELLRGWGGNLSAGQDVPVMGLALDSRMVKSGDVFFALPGAVSHGLLHVQAAIDAGAVAVIYDGPPPDIDVVAMQCQLSVPMICIPGLCHRVGLIAARYYGFPSRDRFVVGVTGTNGKTSCCHYLAQCLSDAETRCATIGTLGARVWAKGDEMAALPLTSVRTTPDAVTLQSEIARLDAHVIAMEVSSHGIDQGRINGVEFDLAVFTNLSRDHLDYHGSFDRYAQTKMALFRQAGLKQAVVNADDHWGRQIIADISDQFRTVAYGLDAGRQDLAERYGCSWLFADVLSSTLNGIQLAIHSSWGDACLKSVLLGRFNASNLMATLAVLLLRGVALDEAIIRLGRVQPVPGRMERFGGTDRSPTVVIDYAHTPDALEQVLNTLRPHFPGRLLCLFGCGGDRDRGKRPLMGRIAERLADCVILTDDNPRFEAGDAIIAAILQGMSDPGAVTVMRDRAAAIAMAVAGAGPEDVILIAGKGHESGQDVMGQLHDFSDRQQVLMCCGGDHGQS